MAELFASGRIIDLILIIMAIEALALLAFRQVTGRGVKPADLLGYLLSGAFLLLALRAALVQAWWGWVGLWLTAALAAHLTDLLRRWRAGAP